MILVVSLRPISVSAAYACAVALREQLRERHACEFVDDAAEGAVDAFAVEGVEDFVKDLIVIPALGQQ